MLFAIECDACTAQKAGEVKDIEVTVDAETRVHDDHHASLRLWLRMLSCTNQIESRVRQLLQAKFDTTLPRFDLMAQLERTTEGLTMFELSQRLMVTRGNVTGIADGLENDGLIVREVDAGDRRVFRAKLTPEGRRHFARMAREHERYIVELFGSMKVAERNTLFELLGVLKKQAKSPPEE